MWRAVWRVMTVLWLLTSAVVVLLALSESEGERFPDWNGVWSFEPGSVTDLWDLILAVGVFLFTVLIAFRQIEIMNKQTEMMTEQSAATKRQEAIAIEQAGITKRQGEIAETQHRIMQEQLTQKATLGVFVFGPDERQDQRNIYPLIAYNNGTKTAQTFNWEFSVNDLSFIAMLTGKEGRELVGDEYRGLSSDDSMRRYFGVCTTPIHPGGQVQFATLVIDYSKVEFWHDQVELTASWVILSEDGRFEGKPDELSGFQISPVDK